MRNFEKVQALMVLIAVSLLVVRAGQLMYVIAHQSLWGDEIVSVQMFSGRGLVTCLSDYSIPNNHVLFNAINAVLPDSGSFDPLRARIVSFVAVSLGLVVAVVATVRRRAWLVLLAFAIAYLGDDRLLGVHLAARGYGMLAMTATLVCVLLWQHLESNAGSGVSSPCAQRWPVVVLAVSVCLGALTVPTFLFFGGSVLLALFCLRPNRVHFLSGLSVFVVVVGYWSWMYISNHGFGLAPAGFFEGEFHHISAPLTLVHLFSLEGWPPFFRYLAIALLLVAPWLIPRGEAPRTTALCLWFGIMGSLAICLLMKRPLMHTVAHLLIPGGFVIGLGMRALALRWQTHWRPAALLLTSVFAMAATAAALRPQDPLHLWPSESWQEIAATIEAISNEGNDGPSVWAPFRDEMLAVYLQPKLKVSPQFDADAYHSGKQIVVASPKVKYLREQVDSEIVDSAEVVVSLRQKAGGFQKIAWNPQSTSRAEVISATPKPGTTSGKTLLLELKLPEQTTADNILYLSASAPIMNKPVVVHAAGIEEDAGPMKLKATAVGHLWAVELRADVDLASTVELVFYSSVAGEIPPGFVAWIGNSIPDAHVRGLLY